MIQLCFATMVPLFGWITSLRRTTLQANLQQAEIMSLLEGGGTGPRSISYDARRLNFEQKKDGRSRNGDWRTAHFPVASVRRSLAKFREHNRDRFHVNICAFCLSYVQFARANKLRLGIMESYLYKYIFCIYVYYKCEIIIDTERARKLGRGKFAIYQKITNKRAGESMRDFEVFPYSSNVVRVYFGRRF